MLTNMKRNGGRVGLAILLGLLIAGATVTLQAADGSGLLSKAELKALIVNAKTPAEHMKVAKHFQAKAESLEAEAKEHAELAKEYRRTPTGHEQKHPGSGQTASHCEFLSEQLAKAAKEARALAAAHEQMAAAAHK